MSAYDTGSMSAVRHRRRTAVQHRCRARVRYRCPASVRYRRRAQRSTLAPRPRSVPAAAPAFDLGATPASDKEGASALEDSLPSAPAEVRCLCTAPRPAANARSPRGQTGNGNELPFRTPAGQPKGGIIVPPTASAGAGEEHRLPIFESVESDWFRRGRHGASRAGHR